MYPRKLISADASHADSVNLVSRMLRSSERRHWIGACLIICVTIAGFGASSAEARTAGYAARYRSCGRIHTRFGTLVVYVKHGNVPCGQARSVIKYVTSHGTPTQGQPGRNPRGWNCYYGYGYYHGNHERFARAGPECDRVGKTVEGVSPGWTPALGAFALDAALGASPVLRPRDRIGQSLRTPHQSDLRPSMRLRRRDARG